MLGGFASVGLFMRYGYDMINELMSCLGGRNGRPHHVLREKWTTHVLGEKWTTHVLGGKWTTS